MTTTRTVRGACGSMLMALLVTAFGGPAAAADGIGADVAAARSAWLGAAVALETAQADQDTRADEFAAAQAALEAATAALDAETAALAARENERAAALLAHDEATAATRHARREAAAATDAHHEATDRRNDARQALLAAAAQSYANGADGARAMTAMVNGLDGAASAADYLQAVRQLPQITVGNSGVFDRAEATLAARYRRLVDALQDVEARAAAQAEALDIVAAARQAFLTQQERTRTAEAERAAAAAARDDRAAALTTADALVAERVQAVSAALDAVRDLGWRAGVPGEGGLVWPVDGAPGSGFGVRLHPVHNDLRHHDGVDVAAATGQPVVAADRGEVRSVADRGGYGLCIEIDHGGGRTTLYAHLSRAFVSAGEVVDEAQLIGAVGSTGVSTGSHLHFEVRQRGGAQDPLRYF